MSPIKDLTESTRLPRLGKIHLGIRHPEKGYPMKTDYFVFPKEHSDYKQIVEVFGEKPKSLRILIPVEDEEEWASQYYRAYDQTHGLICKGDGEKAMRLVDTKTGDMPSRDSLTVTMKEMTCAGKDCPDYKAKKCHEVMNLRFLLPEIPGLGVWQIDTGSINSILNINSCARVIKRAFGRISLIPLLLTLESIQVNNPETGKKQTVYVLNLRTDVTLKQLANAAREQAESLMLKAPELEDIAELWEPEAEKEQGVTRSPDVNAVETTATVVEDTAKAPETTDEPKHEGFIDLPWFKESVATLQGKGLKAWTDKMILSYLKTVYKAEGTTPVEAVSRLSKIGAAEYAAKIRETLEMT